MTAAWVGEWPLSPPWGGGVSGAGGGRAGDWQGQPTVSGTRRRVARVARGIWLSHGREMGTEQRGRRWGRRGGQRSCGEGTEGSFSREQRAPCFWGSDICVPQELAAHRRAQPRQVNPRDTQIILVVSMINGMFSLTLSANSLSMGTLFLLYSNLEAVTPARLVCPLPSGVSLCFMGSVCSGRLWFLLDIHLSCFSHRPQARAAE